MLGFIYCRAVLLRTRLENDHSIRVLEMKFQRGHRCLGHIKVTNADIGAWDTSKVTYVLADNADISKWDTSKVT